LALLFGASALLLVPAAASAQYRFGMGGYRGGYSGYSPGYYNSFGYSPGYYSSYGYSPYGSGYYPGYSTYGGWSNPGYAWGNYNTGGYYGGAYTAPGYAATDFYYNTPGASSYYGSGYAGDMGSSYAYGNRTGAGVRDAALLNVRLPDPNAEVWVDGKQTRQRGTWREYESPPLNPDRNYTYEVRARWTENGRTEEQTRTVPVRANGVATVDFTAPANNSRVDEINAGQRGTGSEKGQTAPEKKGTNPPAGTTPPDAKRPDQP
jgi:uncharacterized protein (TIGR03000 family)